MLVGREPAERLRDAPRAEPPHPLVEGRRELARPDPGPVPTAEELLPQQAEKALGAGVVAAPALARHAAGQAGGLAYREVVAAPVLPSARILPALRSLGQRGLPVEPIRFTHLSALPYRKSHRHGRRLRSSDHLLSSLWRYKVLCHRILTKTADYLERPYYHHSRHRRRHGI